MSESNEPNESFAEVVDLNDYRAAKQAKGEPVKPEQRLPMHVRLRQMSREELAAALRRTAEGNRTHRAERIAGWAGMRCEVYELIDSDE